jgi:hypothetical protein
MLMLSFILLDKRYNPRNFFLMYCNTCENVVDIFTKPLGKIKFEWFRALLGVEFNPFSIKGKTWK